MVYFILLLPFLLASCEGRGKAETELKILQSRTEHITKETEDHQVGWGIDIGGICA